MKCSGLLDYSFPLIKVAQPSTIILASTFHIVANTNQYQSAGTPTNTSLNQHRFAENPLKMAVDAIESNPDVMNKLLAALGVPEIFKVI